MRDPCLACCAASHIEIRARIDLLCTRLLTPGRMASSRQPQDMASLPTSAHRPASDFDLKTPGAQRQSQLSATFAPRIRPLRSVPDVGRAATQSTGWRDAGRNDSNSLAKHFSALRRVAMGLCPLILWSHHTMRNAALSDDRYRTERCQLRVAGGRKRRVHPRGVRDNEDTEVHDVHEPMSPGRNHSFGTQNRNL